MVLGGVLGNGARDGVGVGLRGGGRGGGVHGGVRSRFMGGAWATATGVAGWLAFGVGVCRGVEQEWCRWGDVCEGKRLQAWIDRRVIGCL